MANWFEVRAGTMTEAAARAYFGASNYLKSIARASGRWTCWLPSITDRDEVIARHRNPEIAAILLMKRNEISF